MATSQEESDVTDKGEMVPNKLKEIFFLCESSMIKKKKERKKVFHLFEEENQN